MQVTCKPSFSRKNWTWKSGPDTDDVSGLSENFSNSLVVGLVATLFPYQKVWWNVFDHRMWELYIFFIMTECSQKVWRRPMQSKNSVLRFGGCSLICFSALQEKCCEWHWRLQGLWRPPAAAGAWPNCPVMQPHMPEPLHCPQVQIKNLQMISPGSHWFWLENQVPNFCPNPMHNVKLRKTKSMRLIRSEVIIMWVVKRKGFTRGLANQSDLAADQISQGRRVKTGPK